VIPSQPLAGALRQQVAASVQPLDGAIITKARFTIFLDSAVGDLSALPQSLRGSLSGAGSLTAEITISKEQIGGKGDVEQLAERLPSFPEASYSARLEVLIPPPAAGEAERA
jgi:hypothetical protein